MNKGKFFRLNDQTIELIDSMAEALKTTKSSIVMNAVKHYYETEYRKKVFKI